MINPVFRRETRTALRSWKIFAAMAVYTALLTFAAAITLAINDSLSYNYSFNPQTVIVLYIVLTAFQNVIVAIITPSLTAGAVSGERERQTLDLMLLTKMSTISIVVGKLMSSMLTVLLIIIASLPVFSIVFYYGGVSLWNLFGMAGFTLLFAAMVGSISIFFSTVTKKTVVSTVWTYIIVLALTFGNLIVTALFAALGQYNVNEMALAIFVRLSLAFNPAISFFALVDMQYGIGIFHDFIGGVSGTYNSYTIGTGAVDTILHAILSVVQAVPLWLVNIIIMAGITAAAVMLSAMFIKPVRGGGEKKRG